MDVIPLELQRRPFDGPPSRCRGGEDAVDASMPTMRIDRASPGSIIIVESLPDVHGPQHEVVQGAQRLMFGRASERGRDRGGLEKEAVGAGATAASVKAECTHVPPRWPCLPLPGTLTLCVASKITGARQARARARNRACPLPSHVTEETSAFGDGDVAAPARVSRARCGSTALRNLFHGAAHSLRCIHCPFFTLTAPSVPPAATSRSVCRTERRESAARPDFAVGVH